MPPFSKCSITTRWMLWMRLSTMTQVPAVRPNVMNFLTMSFPVRYSTCWLDYYKWCRACPISPCHRDRYQSSCLGRTRENSPLLQGDSQPSCLHQFPPGMQLYKRSCCRSLPQPTRYLALPISWTKWFHGHCSVDRCRWWYQHEWAAQLHDSSDDFTEHI